jgi:hypothetical protein
MDNNDLEHMTEEYRNSKQIEKFENKHLLYVMYRPYIVAVVLLASKYLQRLEVCLITIKKWQIKK